jgi:4-alpha-glucanotransferase
MNPRAAGILLHPSSLANRYPIGDLGPAATAFVDFLAESGQGWWQMLPIGPVEEDNSPYESPSAFGGNPLLLSPDRLMEQGLLERQDIAFPITGSEGNVNYPAAQDLKLRWLWKAFDHFIGFERSYEVPADAKTAVNGHYEPGGGVAFFEAVRKALGSLPFIADDLGAITPEVVALLDQLQIPGTRVLQFELESAVASKSSPPARHPAQSVVYTGTHDNDTTAGWCAKLPSVQRNALERQLRANNQEVVWAIIGKAMAAKSDTAIIPAQDLLELGSEARMNVPGVAKGNWGWRLKDGALTHEIARKLQSLTRTCGRLASGESRPSPSGQDGDLTPRIAKRAYELYERRGFQNGQTVQNWLLAEQEIQMEAKP